MSCEVQTILEAAEAYVQKKFAEDFSGHDAAHTMRVYRMALTLADQEGADRTITALAALLHDVDDRKLSPRTAAGKDNARAFLESHGIGPENRERILRIIGEVSFRGTDSVVPASAEGRCVQDADRLDALGAIGIARAFAYGGSRGRAMYDPAVPPRLGMDGAAYAASDSTSVNHFYEKLFLLKDLMNTDSGRREAERRERFMRDYLEEFYREWNEA